MWPQKASPRNLYGGKTWKHFRADPNKYRKGIDGTAKERGCPICCLRGSRVSRLVMFLFLFWCPTETRQEARFPQCPRFQTLMILLLVPSSPPPLLVPTFIHTHHRLPMPLLPLSSPGQPSRCRMMTMAEQSIILKKRTCFSTGEVCIPTAVCRIIHRDGDRATTDQEQAWITVPFSPTSSSVSKWKWIWP